MHSIAPGWMWISFLLLVVILLAIDFWVSGNKARVVSIRESVIKSLIYFMLALIFGVLLWLYLFYTVGADSAHDHALAFMAGYFIEKSLSIDNVFVILLIFTYFSIPDEYQRRVLVYGVWGAIVMRLLLIWLGAWAITRFHGIFYFFGAFLVIAGIKTGFSVGQESHYVKTGFARIRRYFSGDPYIAGGTIFYKKKGTSIFDPSLSDSDFRRGQ